MLALRTARVKNVGIAIPQLSFEYNCSALRAALRAVHLFELPSCNCHKTSPPRCARTQLYFACHHSYFPIFHFPTFATFSYFLAFNFPTVQLSYFAPFQFSTSLLSYFPILVLAYFQLSYFLFLFSTYPPFLFSISLLSYFPVFGSIPTFVLPLLQIYKFHYFPIFSHSYFRTFSHSYFPFSTFPMSYFSFPIFKFPTFIFSTLVLSYFRIFNFPIFSFPYFSTFLFSNGMCCGVMRCWYVTIVYYCVTLRCAEGSEGWIDKNLKFHDISGLLCPIATEQHASMGNRKQRNAPENELEQSPLNLTSKSQNS